MSWLTKTTDWHVCSLGQIAGGAVVAGGTFFFIFHSRTANVSGIYSFSGSGIGGGGNASGFLNPADMGIVSSPWTQLYRSTPHQCGLYPFNTHDLNNTQGRITYTGAGFGGVTYGTMFISAFKWNPFADGYFWSQPLSGAGFGMPGIGGGVLVGLWEFQAVTNIHP